MEDLLYTQKKISAHERAQNNKSIRSRMKEQRLRMSVETHSSYSRLCQQYILSSELWKQAENIALYRSFREEVTTSSLIQNAYEEGKNLYFPRCIFSQKDQNTGKIVHKTLEQVPHPPTSPYPLQKPETSKKGLMEFIHIHAQEYANAFDEGAYGIQEPKNCFTSSKLPQNSLVFLPCLAYNTQGFRLGYGGGYYDRFLAKNKKMPYYTVILLAFSFKENKDFYVQEWDVPVNYISTEKGLLCSTL